MGWTRRVLVFRIEDQTYERALLSQTNFAETPASGEMGGDGTHGRPRWADPGNPVHRVLYTHRWFRSISCFSSGRASPIHGSGPTGTLRRTEKLSDEQVASLSREI